MARDVTVSDRLRSGSSNKKRVFGGAPRCALLSSSAVVPGDLPVDGRRAPMAGHPTPRLHFTWSSVVSVSGEGEYAIASLHQVTARWRIATSGRLTRPGDAVASSGVMYRRQSLRLVATEHHPLHFLASVRPVSARGSASPRTEAPEVSVSAAQVLGCPARCASCWGMTQPVLRKC